MYCNEISFGHEVSAASVVVSVDAILLSQVFMIYMKQKNKKLKKKICVEVNNALGLHGRELFKKNNFKSYLYAEAEHIVDTSPQLS
jgi:hypothetical protein